MGAVPRLFGFCLVLQCRDGHIQTSVGPTKFVRDSPWGPKCVCVCVCVCVSMRADTHTHIPTHTHTHTHTYDGVN